MPRLALVFRTSKESNAYMRYMAHRPITLQWEMVINSSSSSTISNINSNSISISIHHPQILYMHCLVFNFINNNLCSQD